jgi:hypothetical protein
MNDHQFKANEEWEDMIIGFAACMLAFSNNRNQSHTLKKPHKSKNNRIARCRLYGIAMSPIANLIVNMYNSKIQKFTSLLMNGPLDTLTK